MSEYMKIIVSISSFVSFILYILAFCAKFGKIKGFRFSTGTSCMVTTIAIAFYLTQNLTGYYYTMFIIFFLATIIMFAISTFSET